MKVYPEEKFYRIAYRDVCDQCGRTFNANNGIERVHTDASITVYCIRCSRGMGLDPKMFDTCTGLYSGSE